MKKKGGTYPSQLQGTQTCTDVNFSAWCKCVTALPHDSVTSQHSILLPSYNYKPDAICSSATTQTNIQQTPESKGIASFGVFYLACIRHLTYIAV